MSSSFSPGASVFFKHPQHCWVLGSVVSVDGASKTYTCKSEDPKRGTTGEVFSKLKGDSDITPAMGSVVDENVQDLLQLTVLHESSLLRCLYLRYMSDVIYTNVGAIVVALNPFTFTIPHYKDDQMARYLCAPPEGSLELLPHTWATAHITYFELLSSSMQPQFILVSGESGSGKTEASKIVVKYLAAVSRGRGSSPTEDEQCAETGDRLQKCSPILECFGNAKTVRNDNSSRFGKLMKIQFTATGVLAGSFTERYLLEKSRIVVASEGERLYHSFYLLFRGELQKSVLATTLQPERHYVSINSGGVLHNEDYDTDKDVSDVSVAMKRIGLSPETIKSVWQVPAGVLHLLNVRFCPSDDGSGCVLTAASSKDAMAAASLWEVDVSDLTSELLQTALVIRNEVSFKKHNEIQASDCRDAICKALYDKLFDWLVQQCNRMCDTGGDRAAGWIGLLDIFGFEDFKLNSFEQLCINLANETLQGHYNTFVFDKDMEECRIEGIDTVDIPCPNNKPCLDLIGDPKKGIFAYLDDQSAMTTGTNEQFVDACVAAYGGGNSPYFVVERTRKNCFSIVHYAGTVRYDCTGWVEKNRDTLKDGMRLVMRASKNSIISELIDAPADGQGGGGVAGSPVRPGPTSKKTYVSTFFRQQLAQLMTIINSSNPHWIRCVKPHPAKKPRMFDGMQAMSQLESSGVLGTVKIRKAGYPVRMHYHKFIDRFMVLSEEFRKQSPSKSDREAMLKDSERSKRITSSVLRGLNMLTKDIAQLGKTKLFMKADALTRLEQSRREFIDKATIKIKNAGRGYLCRCTAAKAIIASAVQRIVREYRDYCLRSASERAERNRRIALLAEQSTTTATDLEIQFRSVISADLVQLNDQYRVPLISVFLSKLEDMQRRIISIDAMMQRQEMLGSVIFDFLISQEAITRQILSESSPMAQERKFLILYAFDTLMDDWVEEEDYTRRKLIAEERVALTFTRSREFFYLHRQIINDEAEGKVKCIVKEWSDTANQFIVAAFFQDKHRELVRFEAEHRSLILYEEDRCREALWHSRCVATLVCQQQMLLNFEARERAALLRVEVQRRGEIDGLIAQWMVKVELAEIFIKESNARSMVLSEEIVWRAHCHELFSDLQSCNNTLRVLDDELQARRALLQLQAICWDRIVSGQRLVLPHLYSQRCTMQQHEHHWRDVMILVEAKYRRRLFKVIGSYQVLLRSESWLRNVMWLLSVLQFAELRQRHVMACHYWMSWNRLKKSIQSEMLREEQAQLLSKSQPSDGVTVYHRGRFTLN